MASYPPPPPAGAPFPPQWDRNAARAQQRAMVQAAKAQRRAVRDQQRAYRYQVRSLRRRSIVGPLILLTAGVIFLLEETGKLSWGHSFDWYARWWPAVLILAGVILLVEWALDERRARETPQPGVLVRGPRSIGGGVVFLLIVLAVLGLSAHGITGLGWHDEHFGPHYEPDLTNGFDRLFGDKRDSYDSVNSAIGADQPLIVRNPHGDVIITGDSSDGQVHVSVHKQTRAWGTDDLARKDRALEPSFTTQDGHLLLAVAQVDGGDVDLTVQIPAATPLTVQADHGDVTISKLTAGVMLSANHGDVSLEDITGTVTLRVNDDDASLTAHSIRGALTVDGRNGDVDITDVSGAVILRGDFFGDTHVQRVNGALSFETSRTHFEAVSAPGEFDVARKDLSASGLTGPVLLTTRDKDISLESVLGAVNITDRNGSIEVKHAAPAALIQITNTHGSVDLTLPPGSNFELSADSHNGNVDNDFDLPVAHDGDAHSAHGTVGSGGSSVRITTSDGDVAVHRGDVAAPVAPRTPAEPAPPVKPGHPSKPASPAPPAKYSF